MAAANCVVITNGGELLEQPISTNSVPRAFFPRVAISCRLATPVILEENVMEWKFDFV